MQGSAPLAGGNSDELSLPEQFGQRTTSKLFTRSVREWVVETGTGCASLCA
jgi:hypothetical protein